MKSIYLNSPERWLFAIFGAICAFSFHHANAEVLVAPLNITLQPTIKNAPSLHAIEHIYYQKQSGWGEGNSWALSDTSRFLNPYLLSGGATKDIRPLLAELLGSGAEDNTRVILVDRVGSTFYFLCESGSEPQHYVVELAGEQLKLLYCLEEQLASLRMGFELDSLYDAENSSLCGPSFVTRVSGRTKAWVSFSAGGASVHAITQDSDVYTMDGSRFIDSPAFPVIGSKGEIAMISRDAMFPGHKSSAIKGLQILGNNVNRIFRAEELSVAAIGDNGLTRTIQTPSGSEKPLTVTLWGKGLTLAPDGSLLATVQAEWDLVTPAGIVLSQNSWHILAISGDTIRNVFSWGTPDSPHKGNVYNLYSLAPQADGTLYFGANVGSPSGGSHNSIFKLSDGKVSEIIREGYYNFDNNEMNFDGAFQPEWAHGPNLLVPFARLPRTLGFVVSTSIPVGNLTNASPKKDSPESFTVNLSEQIWKSSQPDSVPPLHVVAEMPTSPELAGTSPDYKPTEIVAFDGERILFYADYNDEANRSRGGLFYFDGNNVHNLSPLIEKRFDRDPDPVREARTRIWSSGFVDGLPAVLLKGPVGPAETRESSLLVSKAELLDTQIDIRTSLEAAGITQDQQASFDLIDFSAAPVFVVLSQGAFTYFAVTREGARIFGTSDSDRNIIAPDGAIARTGAWLRGVKTDHRKHLFAVPSAGHRRAQEWDLPQGRGEQPSSVFRFSGESVVNELPFASFLSFATKGRNLATRTNPVGLIEFSGPVVEDVAEDGILLSAALLSNNQNGHVSEKILYLVGDGKIRQVWKTEEDGNRFEDFTLHPDGIVTATDPGENRLVRLDDSGVSPLIVSTLLSNRISYGDDIVWSRGMGLSKGGRVVVLLEKRRSYPRIAIIKVNP